ncbi:M12 family metallopeptidase [Massilia sp. METH4]|uniref:M12 family metallopeptidase n=1 Tax=Massilia sp. METH4 TaxID=3123041 RepID=UPI0030CFE730
MSDKYDTVPTSLRASEDKEPDHAGKPHFCAIPPEPRRVFKPGVSARRENLIILFGNKWVSGTTLRYYFFDRDTDGEKVLFTDGEERFVSWVGAEEQLAVVRQAFKIWSDVGIGVRFQEVHDREDAEIRIGFMKGDGAWSFLGRGILDHGPNERTMNFGWDLTRPGEVDTAVHEIGHTLGFPHEHQNPNAGIVWDEEAVYAALAKPPNEWNRDKTFWNIIRKLDPTEVKGSAWDPDSIMHYPFEPGLIKEPVRFFEEGLRPHGGLSARDISWVLALYPPEGDEMVLLKPAQSIPLELTPGEQRNFRVAPQETRKYDFRTFGASDSVMVLFENVDGDYRYVTADDDSGEDTNAAFQVKLMKGREYVLRVRLYHSERQGQTAVMMW